MQYRSFPSNFTASSVIIFLFPKQKFRNTNPFLNMLILQEDVPDEFANLVLNFISRNRIGPHGIEVCLDMPFTNINLLRRLL